MKPLSLAKGRNGRRHTRHAVARKRVCGGKAGDLLFGGKPKIGGSFPPHRIVEERQWFPGGCTKIKPRFFFPPMLIKQAVAGILFCTEGKFAPDTAYRAVGETQEDLAQKEIRCDKKLSLDKRGEGR